MSAIIANNLVKHYKSGKEIISAVRGVSLRVEKGELFGIIGPDGAGKTSLFRMLTTLLLPDDGNAMVDGSDVVKDYKSIRKKVGYMPGRFSLYQDLTVEENLQFFATIFNTTIQENYDLIHDIYIQIEPFKNRKAGKLSGGMKQKLALSCALIHKPVVLFLDEPTTGVDAVSRKEFWDMLKNLKQQGITILVSTPYMDEATLCDRIALMQTGELMTTGTPADIVQMFSLPLFAVKGRDMFRLLKDLVDSNLVQQAYAFGEYHHVIMKAADHNDELQQNLEKNDHKEIVMHRVEPTIEDCFMQLMQTSHD
ncbi:MAG TPA: ABC transporter ATP-binding protein [Flavisolibacter sp.]|nr:ABC transporter ATP-binding protein [Flavisolibacter sp.]